jgi:hypothetical protein
MCWWLWSYGVFRVTLDLLCCGLAGTERYLAYDPLNVDTRIIIVKRLTCSLRAANTRCLAVISNRINRLLPGNIQYIIFSYS